MSRRLAALLSVALALPTAALARQQSATAPDETQAVLKLLDRLDAAWKARDVGAWLALREFASPEERASEEAYARERFASELSELLLHRPLRVAAGVQRLAVGADLVTVDEPRGRVELWRLRLVRRADGWQLASRETLSEISGLIHLSFDPHGYKADGLTLRFEDFELRMDSGTLFTSPASLGPTALAFVGKGRVHVRPRPETEREQLRQYSGSPELDEKVKTVFVRLNPADLPRALGNARLTPDPQAARRFSDAQRVLRQQGSDLYMLDTRAPRSPWWLYPSQGDASVVFETRRGTLTYTVNGSDPEGISLFDRARRRQICLYPLAGGSTHYSEDEGRAADILHHDLSVSFDPSHDFIEGQDTLRVRMLSATSTLRLRLSDALTVQSIRSPQGGQHLFFRVRGQNLVMVSLGSLAGQLGELTLTVRYAGQLAPTSVDHELVQVPEDDRLHQAFEPDIPLQTIGLYANRTPWYPQGSTEDYATADLHFDVPADMDVVTGGLRVSERVDGDRLRVEYRLEHPGRYVTAAVGRMVDAASLQAGAVELHATTVSRLRSRAEPALRELQSMLRFYEREFGPCPYEHLNLVLAEARAPGGHSPPGMLFLQTRPALLRVPLRDDPTNFSDVPGFFMAHEAAHQWWGHGVAAENYHERWISESFAQYAATLWIRESRGEDAFEDVLARMQRWALRESHAGPIRLGFRLGHLKGDPQIFRAIVYDKGALVLHMLHGLIGDAAFRQALQAVQTRHRYQKIGVDEVRRALERASGRDLRPYFDAWLDGTALPELRISERRADRRVSVEVAAKNLPGPLPLELTVVHEQGRQQERVTLPPGGASFSFEAPSRVRHVEANDDRGLLAIVKR